MILSIELPGLPPTLNSRMHWRVIHKRRSAWKAAVETQVSLHPWSKTKQTLERARLVCTRFSSVEPDFDNLVSGFKWVVDQLKISGVIRDDKMSVIGQPEYKWAKCPPKHGKIRVEVYALGDAISRTIKGDG